MSQRIFDDDFQNLCDTLENLIHGPEVDARYLEDELDQRIDELKKLLDVPPKNDAARKKLTTLKLELDGQEYQINDQFAQEATQISDDYNLDELAAAKLLIKGQQQQEQLDRTPSQSATFIFHTRRKNLLDAIRLILSYVADNRVEGRARGVLDAAVEKLLAAENGGPTFTDRCISAMSAVRESVRQLREKERHMYTLQLALDQSKKEDMELQLRFLRSQHELLSSIVFYLVKLRSGDTADIADLKRLLGVLRDVESNDCFMVHLILPLVSYISTLCGTESPILFTQAFELHKEIIKDYNEAPWKIRTLQAGMLVWWLTEFNGLCNDAEDVAGASYIRDVATPMKTAFRDGGMEFIMALTSDIGSPVPLNSAKEGILQVVLQNRVPPMTDTVALLPEFRDLMLSQVEAFVESFITNMAEILKEVKNKEEDDILIGQKTIDFELERFFLIVHFVYHGRPDSGIEFWSDPESQLYGFLGFAAQTPTPLMEATFSYMMASISQGPDCAVAAHKFLLDESAPGIQRIRKISYVNWNYVFKQLQTYVEQLIKEQSALTVAPGYKPTPAAPAAPSVESALALTLDGHLRLASQLITDSPAARQWILEENRGLRFMALLFSLLNRLPNATLLDSIFSALSALLTDKSAEMSNFIWDSLDAWVMGSEPPPNESVISHSTTLSRYPSSATEKFDVIINDIHAAEAFVRLLGKLVEPPADTLDLKDSLPFAEIFGGQNRITGMEPYTDVIMESIFANTPALDAEPAANPDQPEGPLNLVARNQHQKFRPAMQLACLQFIYICLASFNEDLLSMAHKNLSIDGGIRASSLEVYTKLHPFGRVMEHILSQKSVTVFFEILHKGTDQLLGYIDPPPPVVETIQYTIMILNLAIQMQPTYTRVVKPFLSQSQGNRRNPVKGNGFTGLEKAVSCNLQAIVDLGLYVGARQPEIVLESISLLEKFNICEELVASADATTFVQYSKRNRVLGVIEQSEDSRRIIFNFLHQWDRSLGPEEPFVLKMPILRFIEQTLTAQPNEYSLAHFILGFGYDPKDGICLSTAPGGIGSGSSILHHIMEGAQTNESELQSPNFLRHLCEFKNTCYSILYGLWKSPATSGEILHVLRANKFFFQGFTGETMITQEILWEDAKIEPSMRFLKEGSYAFCNFIRRRTALLEYTALEIRQIARQGASTMLQSYLSTLNGLTIVSPEERVTNVHILDLLDFLEFPLPESLNEPKRTFFADCNILAFRDDSTGIPLFNYELCASYLDIKQNELIGQRRIADDQLAAVIAEKKQILALLFAQNQLLQCRAARFDCLKAWSTLIRIMLEDCEMEEMPKALFILQSLQTILPKLEMYSTEDIYSAEVLSSLALALISHTKFDPATIGVGKGSDLAADRLYQLFRVSLRAVQSPLATPKLRENFYNVALQYLTGMATLYGDKVGPETRRYNTQTIRSSGERLLEVLCNDAYAGDGALKVISLLLLEALAALGAEDQSTYVVDVLVRQNFLVVLIDSIKNIGSELQNAVNAEARDFMVAAFKAATAFLFRIAQTRPGATQVFDAGLFVALRDCQLFSVDPDLGLVFIGLDVANALTTYYDLLLHILRVVVTVVLSRGHQNMQTLDAARKFLLDNREVATTVFKRHAGIGGDRTDGVRELQRLAECFVLLFSLTEDW
ncbi:hypothetical protein EX30DRAFT_332009 [Ascodesmis nigricans]|uniref:Nucleoporin Nup186/Nup192/Nup205 n=1 Tax=Ascodesmis nigricans TaxID=341454 RepID=A0A4S2MV80_9PEZI|nr:hypothetical protein EX30DRAFT_332009 [Ascodesmis nigricans]